MSGWIKFDKDMATDPRLFQAAADLLDTYTFARRTPGGGSDLSDSDALRLACHALRGALLTLWCYADEHIRDDDALPCDARALDALVGIDGFCAALPDEWLAVRDDGAVTLPGYCAKNSLISKKKRASRSAERQKRYRERTKASRTPSVTHNAKRDRGITKGGDQDQDLYQDREKKEGALARALLTPGLDQQAFEEWRDYRKSVGKTLKPQSLDAAAKHLASFGSQQAAAVQHSIANGYQGLFAPKENHATPTRKSFEQQQAELARLAGVG